MGTENFKKAIQAYYAKYMNSNATTDNFITEMEAVAHENLKPFFKQWLNNPYILKIGGDWAYDTKTKEIKVNLRQKQTSNYVFDVPLEVAIYASGNNTPIIKRFNVHDKEAGFTIPNSDQPAFIVIDPRNVLLADFNFKQKIK
jgi:aminopeptidase N